VSCLDPCPGGHRVRLKAGRLRARFFIPSEVKDAETRAVALRALADQLRKASPVRAKIILERAACAPTESLFRQVAKLAEEEPEEQAEKATPLTFKELGERWTSGKLAREYPDQLRTKRTADDDAAMLERHVYPVIGEQLLTSITLEDCERVMRRLTEKGGARRKKLSPLTRRNVGQSLVRLLAIAVYPLRMIPASPIPKGFLPKASSRKALTFLYPGEEAKLMGCATVPIERRLLWGFLAREGMRLGEALALRWADIEAGVVRLDRNKTDDPRAWSLDAGVLRALDALRGDAEDDALVFTLASPERASSQLRDDLEAADVKRAELFARSDVRLPIRAHDLRGSFVTIALANGRSEAWVTDRTGHRSSQMVYRYKRAARTATEARLGDWNALDVALGVAEKGGQRGGLIRSQLRDLNPRPTVYETVALPLS
jgi:integrase